MRAHFAGDVVTAAADELDSTQAQQQLQQQQKMEQHNARIADFKRNAASMQIVAQFIDDVLQNAETEALKQQNAKNAKNSSQKPKEKSRQSFAIPDFKNGKVVNRARGLVVRLFDAICNCANTAAAAAPTQRIKLRGKRASSTQDAGETVLAEDNINGKEKSKKADRTKEKKDDSKMKIDDEEPPQQKNKVDDTTAS